MIETVSETMMLDPMQKLALEQRHQPARDERSTMLLGASSSVAGKMLKYRQTLMVCIPPPNNLSNNDNKAPSSFALDAIIEREDLN